MPTLQCSQAAGLLPPRPPPEPHPAQHHSLGAGPGVAKGHVLVAGDGWDVHGLLLGGAGGRAHGALLGGLLPTARAVEAVAILGGLVALAAQRALAQGAPGVAVQVRLAAAGLDLLHEADVTARTQGAADAPGVLAAPVVHLAVGAEAPMVSLTLEGPVVDLAGEREKGSVESSGRGRNPGRFGADGLLVTF